MNHHDSHVVLAWMTSGKIFDRAEHGKQRGGSSCTAVHLRGCQQPFHAELKPRGITTFDNPVGITQQAIASPRSNSAVVKAGACHYSEKRSAFLQALHLSVRSQQQCWRMTRVAIGNFRGVQVEASKKQSG